jgi:hypothetical protein
MLRPDALALTALLALLTELYSKVGDGMKG